MSIDDSRLSDAIPCPHCHDTTRRAFLLATDPPTWFCITCKIERRDPVKTR